MCHYSHISPFNGKNRVDNFLHTRNPSGVNNNLLGEIKTLPPLIRFNLSFSKRFLKIFKFSMRVAKNIYS